MIKLSKRLETIAKIILNGNSKKIIDVGCDHALLDIYLVQNNENLNVVASDINELPLKNARKNIEKYSFLNKIELSLRDGIKNIDDEIDTIVISGMGYETIKGILLNGKKELENVDRLVISSNNKYEKVREEITSIGYVINYEEIVYEDGKYYIIIEFIKGNKKYNKKELYFGPVLISNKENNFYDYYNYIRDTKISILESLPKEYEKRKEVEKEIELLNEELK